jgi:hypothetical protein
LVNKNAGARRMRMADETGPHVKSEAISSLFLVGMATMLLLPLLVALCCAWYCFAGNSSQSRQQRQRGGGWVGVPAAHEDSEEGEQEALRPQGHDIVSPLQFGGKGSGDKVRVTFRRTSSRLMRMQQRSVTMSIRLDGVESLPVRARPTH